MDRWNTWLLVGALVAAIVVALLAAAPCPMPVCRTIANCPTECPVTAQWIPVAVIGVAMGATLVARLLIAEARRRGR